MPDNILQFESTSGFSGANLFVSGGATFTSLTRFSAGLTTSFLFAAIGSTFGSTLQVNGGATLASTLDVTGVAKFSGGVTFSGTTDHAGVNRFAGGVTFSGQVNATTFKLNTVGGDEGGQIDFGLAATNTSLTGGVAIDIYQNRLRFFESGGNNRGGFIDLTTASNGVGTNLIPQVTSVNGLTGAIGTLIAPIAVTGGNYTVFTFPNGVTTTGSKRPYYQSPYYGGRATSTAAMVANRTYFMLHNTPRGVSLTTLKLSTASTGVTGNVHFSVWSVNTSSGVPDQRLYASASIAIPGSFNFATVTNSNGLVGVPAGSFYIAASFSSTPTLYVHLSDRNTHVFGSQDYTSGYNFYLPVMDTNGFTAPSSIKQSGTTFGFIEYYPTTLTIPILEWQGA